VTTGIDMALAMAARGTCMRQFQARSRSALSYMGDSKLSRQSHIVQPVLQAQMKGDSPFADLIWWIHARISTHCSMCHRSSPLPV
jgi:hypothetical protein